MLKRYVTTCFALLLVLLIPDAASAGRLQSKAQRIILSAGLDDTRVAVLVKDLDSEQILLDINSSEPMIPASNMKLVVSAAALNLLGPDFVFRTELRLIRPNDWRQLPSGAILHPSFNPDDGPVLVVQGDGDPAFCDQRVMHEHDMDIDQLIQMWVEAVSGAGVRKIQQIIVDDRVFDRQMIHPSWPNDQLNMWYCAQVSGLNMNRNCLDVYVEPTFRGQSPRVTISPSVDFLKPSNRSVTGHSDTFWISRKLNTNELTYWGKIRNHRSIPYQVTIHDPATFFAKLLANRLRQSGIEIDSIRKPDMDDLIPSGEALHAVQTTLPVVLARCNKDSQGLYAEALLKRTGRQFTGSQGSWSSGAAAVRAFLNDQVGPRSATVIIADGSGLSRHNRLPPRVMIDLLSNMHQHKELGPVWRESLSISGVDGTLRNRFGRRLVGRVYGKSGYIDGVSCLSGYLVLPGPPTAGGRVAFDGSGERTIAFCMMFNEIRPPVHKIKKLQERLVDLIHDEVTASVVSNRVGG